MKINMPTINNKRLYVLWGAYILALVASLNHIAWA